MMQSRKKIAVSLLLTILICCIPRTISADSELHVNTEVSVNGDYKCKVMGLILNYDNNLYVSMKGVAYALRDTGKAFSVSFSDGDIMISTGEGFYEEPHIWEEAELNDKSKIKLGRNELYVNGSEKKYFSMIGSTGESDDVFMNPVTIGMMLDMDIDVDGSGMNIHVDEPFSVTADEIENSGYMQGVSSLLAGDGTTGDIYYSYDVDEIVPIASTTKLMTYFVMMDAVSEGTIALTDNAMISKGAQLLSEGIDGTIPMSAGQSAPLSEFIYGMLLKSSNECALAIAEHVAGTEEAFVQKMNNKASEIGLSDAYFYNCNGLPIYEKQMIPAKMQNKMTAKDMFVLASELIKQYPQVLDITSTKSIELPTLSQSIKNTNAILYNINEAKGLKTGTTNKSGACLVTCIQMEKNGEIHNLITVLFGAEGETERATITEVVARYAMQELYKYEGGAVTEEQTGIPSDPEAVVRKLIKTAMDKH